MWVNAYFIYRINRETNTKKELVMIPGGSMWDDEKGVTVTNEMTLETMDVNENKTILTSIAGPLFTLDEVIDWYKDPFNYGYEDFYFSKIIEIFDEKMIEELQLKSLNSTL